MDASWLRAGIVAAFLSSPMAASAAPVGDWLGTTNLTVLEDLDSRSEVEGRVVVGGDLTGPSATFYTRPEAGDDAALSVAGNLRGGWKNVNGAGDLVVGGSAGWVNMNGGTAYIGGELAGPVNGRTVSGGSPLDVPAEALMALSRELAGHPGENVPDPVHGRARLAAEGNGTSTLVIPDGEGYLAGLTGLSLDVAGGQSLVINVLGEDLRFAANPLAGVSEAARSRVLWNFPEARTLEVATQFNGSLLAPSAALTNLNELNGSVVAGSLVQHGEVHGHEWQGGLPQTEPAPVSEPTTLVLFLIPAMGLFAVKVQSLGRR